MALKAAALNQNDYLKKYAYQRNSDDEPSSSPGGNFSQTYSNISDLAKANNQSYALTLKCGHCAHSPIFALFMKEEYREVGQEREFMSFLVSHSATNVCHDEEDGLITSCKDLQQLRLPRSIMTDKQYKNIAILSQTCILSLIRC